MISSKLLNLSGCVSFVLKPPPCAVLPVLRMNYSVASTEAKPVRISKNLSFRPAYDSHLSQQERPLVLVYGWLVAKAKHIHKYGDFYLKKGFDVLHIKVTPSQLLRPTLAQGVIKQAVGFTKEAKHRQQPLLIHGFSVGGYLFGETLVQMRESQELQQHFGDRIQGQIMDSPVDFHGIPYGVSQAVTQIPVVQRSMQASLEMYLKVFQNQTKAYLRSSETFRANEFRTPTLFLYSQADKVGPAERIEEVAGIWREKGIDVTSCSFPDSPHVSHFHMYPVEYISALTQFLQKIGLHGDTTVMETVTMAETG